MQDYQNWRCVFVDGYSTDGSWEYMQQFSSDPRFLLLRGRQKGMYEDWNECLQHINTEYFYFLTSDDTCFPDLASTTIKALDTYRDIDICHFQFSTIDESGKTIQTPEVIIQNEFDLYQQVNQYAHRRDGICEFFMHFIYGPLYRTVTSLVFRKRLLAKIKPFSSQYGSIGDYDWSMRLGLHSDILYTPKLLATWRVYHGQATQGMESSKNKQAALKIANSNLNRFEELGRVSSLKKQLDKDLILSNLSDEFSSASYQEIISKKQFPDFLFKGLLFAANHPNYLLTRTVKYISGGKFYSVPFYFRRKEFAQRLIKEYGLKWPPEPISIFLDGSSSLKS